MPSPSRPLSRWTRCTGAILSGFVVGCATSGAPASSGSASPAPAEPGGPAAAREEVVPTRYDEDRFFARPVAARNGEVLDIYLDTGGNNVLYSDVADRLELPRVPRADGGETWTEVPFPDLSPSGSMPLPQTREGRVLVFDRGGEEEAWSGILGPEWFGGRCWRFDYPRQRLVLLRRGEPPAVLPSHQVELGFAEGLNFPRIQVVIDDQPLDLLLDTGAHTRVTPPALAALGDGRAAVRATSFITNSVFRRWMTHHPDWRVLEEAETPTGESMIEVPELVVAGFTTGPVWFTRRDDANFHQYMSQWMDRRIDGALGGNALRAFRVTIDYPGRRAYFEEP